MAEVIAQNDFLVYLFTQSISPIQKKKKNSKEEKQFLIYFDRQDNKYYLSWYS